MYQWLSFFKTNDRIYQEKQDKEKEEKDPASTLDEMDAFSRDLD